jgi:hypothetical protein
MSDVAGPLANDLPRLIRALLLSEPVTPQAVACAQAWAALAIAEALERLAEAVDALQAEGPRRG